MKLTLLAKASPSAMPLYILFVHFFHFACKVKKVMAGKVMKMDNTIYDVRSYSFLGLGRGPYPFCKQNVNRLKPHHLRCLPQLHCFKILERESMAMLIGVGIADGVGGAFSIAIDSRSRILKQCKDPRGFFRR